MSPYKMTNESALLLLQVSRWD